MIGMSNEIKKRLWFRLDNSASVYPMVITLNTQSLFRVGVVLNESIDKDDLQEAAEKTFERFPYYKVELRSGLFRYSFVVNHRKFPVEEDNGTLLTKIDFGRNNAYLLRVTYYKNKLFVDFFHGLCDGLAALEFIKTLLHNYFAVRGVVLPTGNLIKTTADPENEEEISDGFVKYFKKFNIAEGTKKMAGPDAFGLTGKRFRKEGFGAIQGTVRADELKAASKKYGCTITVLLAALAMLSVSKTAKKDSKNRDYVVFIPVNLRKFFPSETMMNFTTIIKCRIPQSEERTIENYAAIIDRQLKEQLDKEDLSIKLSFTSLLYKRVFKFLPLVVKSFFAKVGRLFSISTKQTMIISNVGQVKLPDEFSDKVDSFVFNLNCSKKTPNNMAVISYKDKITVSFTRQLVSTELETEFFRSLSGMGVSVEIVSNMREVRNEM